MKIRHLAFLGLIGCATVASADELYGLSSSTPGTVYRVDKATGNATVVTNLVGSVLTSFVDIEFLGGVAYASDVLTTTASGGSEFTFGSINLNTGAYTVLNNQDGSSNWFALASKESANLLYAVDFDAGNILKTVTSLGVTNVIGATGVNVRGMTYDTLIDELYAIDGNSLYTLDQVTGASTLVGNVVNGTGDGDLAYDVESDTLYLVDTTNLYTVDRSTGLATLVGPTNQAVYMDGLGSLRTVPEPASMFGLGSGLLLLLRRRKK